MPSVYIQSSVFLPTPSGGAGAVELLVAKMAEGLARRGWDVTLFALEGSHVEGVRVMPYTRYGGDSVAMERKMVTMIQMPPPDVIFDHSLYMLAGQRRGPYVAMSHGMAPLPSWARNVVFTSEHHGRLHKFRDPKALLLGIDLADIPPPSVVGGAGLFWAGRIMPYKRLEIACDIARLSGMPLRVAGPVVDEQYWRDICAVYMTPAVGEPVFTYLGELPHAEVLREMAGVRFFLFTSDATEPAGLTMLEAQACGTPVIAVNEWSAREYIDNGSSGWIAQDAGDAASLIRGVEQADGVWGAHSDEARRWVAAGFTSERMVDRAEVYLRRAMEGERW